jgi:hypothetical protein
MNFLNNLAFIQYLDDLNFLCIFHKQAGSRFGFESGTGFESGSESGIKVEVGYGYEQKISDPQHRFSHTKIIYAWSLKENF